MPANPTILGVLNASIPYLQRHGISEAENKVSLLLERVTRIPRLRLTAEGNRPLSEKQAEAMRRGVQRLGTGEPVQYILGKWDFRNATLHVDRRALIPRPETESLVQLALDDPYLRSLPRPKIVDFGTGSGCIAISLAMEMPKAAIMALDISQDALDLAAENARLNGVGERVAFVIGELSDNVEPMSVDAIVSNPPYIPSATVDGLDKTVRDFEPRMALDGGRDGVRIIEMLAEEASMALSAGGRIFMELSAEDSQARPVCEMLRSFGFDNARPHKDLFGRERFVSATLSDGV